MRFYFRPADQNYPRTPLDSNRIHAPSSIKLKIEYSYLSSTLNRSVPAYQLLLHARPYGGDKFPSDSIIRAGREKKKTYVNGEETTSNDNKRNDSLRSDTQGQKFEKNSRFLSRPLRVSQYYLRARGAHRSRPPSSFSSSFPRSCPFSSLESWLRTP